MFDVHTVRELRSQRDAWEGPSVFSTLPNAGTDAWDIRPTETIVRQSLLLQLDTESQSADLGAAARRSFSLLDVDQDEMISAQEWRASRRIRLAFERAGIDVSGSMSAEEFVRHFVATMGRPESNE
jgi:Ca2+-binding EF-hand superfamily protein